MDSSESPSLSNLVATWTIAALLMAGMVLAASATMARGDDAYTEPGLGSPEEYVNTSPDSSDSHEIPLLGIEVNNGMGSLKGDHPFSGIEIIRVLANSPAAAAGLQGRSEKVQTVMTLGLMAGAMFFPPAMIGVMALQQSGIGQSHQLIIAVDGQRTRDLTDLALALQEATAGEIVYLTVISRGEREQIRVALPPYPRKIDADAGSF